MELKPNDRTLRQILSTFFFVIPRFQRPYSWQVENVEELWEDAIQDSNDDYFIGSMVVHTTKDDTMAVIDGQQRLTTLVTLLCVLRDTAEAQGIESLANGTHTFIERKDENDQIKFVLHTETSYPFLHDEILSRGEAELDAKVGSEELAIQAAHERITRYVRDLVTAINLDSTLGPAKKANKIQQRLQEIRDRVLGLRTIFIEVGTQDDATTIFVTLNSRGKDLEPSDLVKAHLLQLLPKRDGLDRPLVKWQGIVDLFDSSEEKLNMTSFLLAVWRSRYEVLVTTKTLHKKVKKQIKKTQAKAFLEQLVADAELYRQVSEPPYRKWRKDELPAREILQFMRDFSISQPMPLLLSLMRECDARRITFRQLRRSFRAIEDYHFTWKWYTLANKSSSGGMSNLFARRAIDLLTARTPQRRTLQIDGLVDDLRQRRPSDGEFDEAFLALWFTDDRTSDKKIVQYILRRFYQHYKGNGVVDFEKMTIEHLASQSSTPAEVGRLGNLMLLSKDANRGLGNKSFAVKKVALRALNGEWVPAEILNATKLGRGSYHSTNPTYG